MTLPRKPLILQAGLALTRVSVVIAAEKKDEKKTEKKNDKK